MGHADPPPWITQLLVAWDKATRFTALVNEAYLRFVDVQQMNWQDRAQVVAVFFQ